MTAASALPNGALRMSASSTSQSGPSAQRARATSRATSSIPRIDWGQGAGGQVAGQAPLAAAQVEDACSSGQQAELQDRAEYRISAQLAACKVICEAAGPAIGCAGPIEQHGAQRRPFAARLRIARHGAARRGITQ